MWHHGQLEGGSSRKISSIFVISVQKCDVNGRSNRGPLHRVGIGSKVHEVPLMYTLQVAKCEAPSKAPLQILLNGRGPMEAPFYFPVGGRRRFELPMSGPLKGLWPIWDFMTIAKIYYIWCPFVFGYTLHTKAIMVTKYTRYYSLSFYLKFSNHCGTLREPFSVN